MTRLIVGLGNPRSRDRGSRHNAGAMVVEALGQQWGIRLGRRCGAITVGEGTLEETPVVLGIPRTFMNESGAAMADLVRRWPVPVARVLVVCDDVALPYGLIRIRPGGSDGGHRGLRSVADALGSVRFPRLRIGIGQRDLPTALDAFVLAPFGAQERRRWPTIEGTARACCALWVREGVERAMNRYNRKVRG